MRDSRHIASSSRARLAGTVALAGRRVAVTASVIAVALVQLGGSRAAVTNASIGDWSAPFAWPIVAVHMSLTSTGEIYSLDGFNNALNSETLWNPGTGTFRSVPYGRNLFCSGHIQVADGRTLVIGGHISAYQGLKDTTLYDAATNTYTRGADMAEARWYPTVTQLPDGRVLTLAGDRIVQDRPGATPPFSDASVNSLPELYNPQTNTWTSLTSGELTSPLYPFLFVLSDGRIFNAGPDTTSRVLTPGSWTWSTVAASPFDGHSAVMYRPDKIMKSGTWADPDFAGASKYNAHGRTAVIDMSDPTPQWRETAPMAYGRSYHNLTLLPDGTVLASGGGSQSDGVTIADSVLPAEIWNPDTETWATVDSLTNGRLYHSTALLLPDGRVLMAGGGALPCCAQVDQRNAEIYSPPYLFKGARPTITSAPTTVAYGASFDVTTPDAADITRVSLIRLPSVTHAFDQNQRFQFLSFTVGAGKLMVQGPGTANLAPPGDYMLFILNGNGVPSVASFVRIQAASGDTSPPTAPTNLAASSPSTGTVNLTWTAATDDTAVTKYNVHRSTTAGFTPTAGNRIAQPTGTSYSDTGLGAGTYFYKVTAEDAAGNVGQTSGEVSVTITAGPAPGLVAAWAFDEGSGTTTGDATGKGHGGTISGAAWTTSGKFGRALSFDGVNDIVNVADASDLDLTTGMTLEAWVRPSALGNVWRTVLMKEQPGDMVYDLYANGSGGAKKPSAEVFIGSPRAAAAATQLTLNTWAHLAATYDGNALRLYVNGSQAAQTAFAGSIATSAGLLRIGGNTIWSEWFAGLIDEVRIYNRPLTAAEIQLDMATAVGVPDTTPPSPPTNFAKTGGMTTTIATSWTASTDDVGVTGYNLFRGATQVATVSTTSYTFTSLTCGTSYGLGVEAVDAAGNVSTRTSLTASTDACDTTPPSAPGSLGASVSVSSIALTWTAATDNVGVVRYNVHRSTTSGFTPSATNRIAQPTGTTYTDAGLAAGTYFYRVTAEDAAGNVGPPSNEASGTVVAADTTPPSVALTAPIAGATVSATVAVSANASDNVSVAGVQFKLDGANLGAEDTSAPYSVSWDTTTATNGTHALTAVARDPSGNTATSAGVSVTVSNVAPQAGLVGAWSFDAGSGTTAADVTGNGHTGTLTNATWATSGKFGQALSFNGSNAWVTVPNAGDLALTTGMTLEAWVQPTALGTVWRTVVFKEQAGDLVYGMYANRNTGVPNAQVYVAGAAREANGTGSAPLNAWSHLAATYDGNMLRLYLNGAEVGQLLQVGSIATSSGVLRIGGNSVWPEWFQGLIDEVRVYNRALSASEIQADMTRPVGTPDTTPPSAPGTLSAAGSLGQASLTWGVATDNVGVSRYNVHRSASSGFTPSTANRIAQPTGTTYTDAGLASGTYFYKVTAEDAAGNIGPPSNEASAVVTSDTTPPSVSITAPTAGATVSNTVSATATASDNVSVAGVQFRLDGASLGTEDTSAPYSVAWDTTTAANGSHTLTAVARDPSGNQTTSAAVGVTVSNSGTPPPTGLVAAYGFDEGSGATASDAGPNGNTGTLSGPTWTIGRFGTALQFDGVNDWVTVADSAPLDITRMTLEAWVYPTTTDTTWRTVLFKEQSGDLVYGMYAQTNTNQPSGDAYVSGSDRVAKGTAALPVNQWSHLAASYDGSAVRLYVNASLVGSTTFSGSIATSSGALRIGGNAIWPEWFAGRIDEVRVYNRALSAAEIQSDMSRSAAPDATAPTVTVTSPATGAVDVPVSATVTATFSEAMDASSLTPSSFELNDGTGTPVPATVSYDPIGAKATLTPSGALVYATTYTAVVHGGASGSRAKDASGNPLAADRTWTFSTEGAPPPILVLGSTANPFSTYAAELLRAEGMNDFVMLDVSLVNPALLSFYDVVVLGDAPLTATQVTTLSNWVTGGGNLIALSPDKQLAGLLGLTDAAATIADKYLKVDNAAPGAAGITSTTMQYHGSADRYTLSGATVVATLYSTVSAATTNPAVTIRAVGASGGQAVAFTYDLARSVALTRQGNPAWAGQERDGIVPIRPDDLFYGAKTGDVQPDWVDLSKLSIPQADEQQRLLANLIVTTASDRKPLPRFWYLPRMAKAVVVMTGDDHAVGGTAGRFDQYKTLSSPGCNVANWECVRSTSYIYPQSPLTNAQAQAYQTDGFEVALHPQTGQPCANWTPSSLRTDYTTQLNSFRAKYTSVGTPLTNRTHCVSWSDWLTMARVEGENGARLDTNYYHYPSTWIGSVAGFMTGGGFPMRFADTDGTSIDVYLAHTFMTDESGQAYPATVNALLDGALGTNGYYGAFTANMHTDNVSSAGSDAIVASAQARGVPIISAKQLLSWWEGREASTMRSFSWTGSQLTFNVSAPAAANGLRMLLPRTAVGKTLSGVTRDGAAVSFTLETIKGIEYAIVPASTGAYRASYA